METTDTEVELYRRKEGPDGENSDPFQADSRQKQEIVGRLEALQTEGKISDFDTFSRQGRTLVQRDPTRGGSVKWATKRYDAYSRWALRQDLTLEPHFQERDGHISFPPLYLVVHEGSSLDVKAVFPCSDGNREYGIEDYLSAKEEGRDWRTEGRGSSPIDYGPHGAIKAYLKERSSELLGPDWRWDSDEYPVHRGHGPLEEEGRIDLVFRHETDTRFLLVEVKPTEDEVDKAFGQILRYKYQFLEHREIPGLTPEDVELCIASTDFYESHQRAAAEIGVQLVTVGTE